MDDCIEREKAIELIQPHVKPQAVYGEGYLQAIEHVTEILELMPAADVLPVKHGYWEEVIGYGGWGDTHYRCSVCGEEWCLEDGKSKDNNMNFCPRCGARMDGDVKRKSDFNYSGWIYRREGARHG